MPARKEEARREAVEGGPRGSGERLIIIRTVKY
jgi:hypothetical protein